MTVLTWLFSKKHSELKIIATTILFLIALPMIAIVVIASSGVSAISAALAVVNPQSHDVTIYDLNGNPKDTIHLETIWPTQGYVSSEFGATEDIRHELGLGSHTGIDISNDFGISIYAFSNGSVLRTDSIGLGTCGKYVQLTHISGISSLYCHLEEVDVKAGDTLKQGDLLGKMGSTGASTGPHLHFQINVNGIPVNPRTFVSGEPDLGATHAPRSIVPGL